jgi:hypothetical protein
VSTCKRDGEVTIQQDRLFDFFHVKHLCELVDSFEKMDGEVRDTVYKVKRLLSETAAVLGVPADRVHIESPSIGPAYVGVHDPEIDSHLKSELDGIARLEHVVV